MHESTSPRAMPPVDAVNAVIDLAVHERLSHDQYRQLLIALNAVGRDDYEDTLELCAQREKSRFGLLEQIEDLRTSLAELRAVVDIARSQAMRGEWS